MGKYEKIIKDVYSIFGSQDWEATGISTYPADFVKATKEQKRIRVSVLPSGNGINLQSATGVLIVDIFVVAGGGGVTAASIADQLDVFLVGKSIVTDNCRVQFGASSFAPKGIDKTDPTLFHSIYSITFNYFEATI